MIEFQAWPKIARLNRDIIITEKIDGTNAAITIEEHPFGTHIDAIPGPAKFVTGPPDEEYDGLPTHEYLVAAQSRKRLISPKDDNFGFAAWVYDNADDLVRILGPGTHFGEWWGSGIQRGYGCEPGERYFSLFNVKRWDDKYEDEIWAPMGLSIVPVLYWGMYDQKKIDAVLRMQRIFGSLARIPFDNPEGIVIYHTAANEMFKVTLENDEAPKSLAA